MLLKLKKYYAGAYMDKKNNFHFIKIKGISTQQQGAAIVMDEPEKVSELIFSMPRP